MRRIARIIIVATVAILSQHAGVRAQGKPPATPAYLGFDRNDYPGDENLARLRQTFSYTGFWLNPPPGEKTNTWAGKRQTVEAAGLGFLVLYNGRLFAVLKTVSNAGRLGKSDAQSAIADAQREGFPSRHSDLSRSRGRRPDAAGAESISLCLGGRNHSGRFSRGDLLLRHRRQGRWRRECHHG